MLADKLNERRKNSASIIKCNLCNMEAIPKMIDHIEEKFNCLDILINNTKIAKGEVVMIGERFGVRFGEIVDPEKRMESL